MKMFQFHMFFTCEMTWEIFVFEEEIGKEKESDEKRNEKEEGRKAWRKDNEELVINR